MATGNQARLNCNENKHTQSNPITTNFNPLLGQTGQALSSHWIVSLSKTVRSCTPLGGRSIDWTLDDNIVPWFVLLCYTHKPHKGHLCKQERKRPTQVQMWLSRNQALLGKAIPREWVPVSGMKVWSLMVLSNNSAFHR